MIDGRFRVEEVIGEGGMGVVYRCRHIVIDKKVAIKVLRSDLAREEEATTRFLNEAKSASAIGNPHIIDISDFGRLPDGATYFVMEYLEGEPLSALTDRGETVPERRIIHIARQLADGLASAHQSGIVHRDLKPDNIFLATRGTETDFVKILDFGIAKVSSTEGKITRAGAVFGTPHYMSPEQALGIPLDHRGDIYSLGVMLYELASGQVPFDGDHFMSILSQHIHKPAPPFGTLDEPPGHVSPGLEAIILKCLSKEPEQRYASMQALIADLDTLVQGLEPAAACELSGRVSHPDAPIDYFAIGRVTNGSAPTLTIHKAWSRWSAGAAIVLAATAVVLLAILIQRPTAPHAGATPPARPAQRATGQVSSERSSTFAAKQVVVSVNPKQAHIIRDGRDLGPGPAKLSIEPGAPVEVVVSLANYQAQTIRLDGSQALREVTLERAPVKKAAKKPSGALATKTSDGIVDPWGKNRTTP